MGGGDGWRQCGPAAAIACGGRSGGRPEVRSGRPPPCRPGRSRLHAAGSGGGEVRPAASTLSGPPPLLPLPVSSRLHSTGSGGGEVRPVAPTPYGPPPCCRAPAPLALGHATLAPESGEAESEGDADR
uniref:Uncharacterized protein n=1 Tax=Oryza sativa subsp. japonica TaxID=39947 RepID=Q6EQA9_ORYSJ|nr:hypothetical protein [Oryza sativa Japonica Group]BAD29161.1 hypothetical protein [Oryza sativa Japonica Group]